MRDIFFILSAIGVDYGVYTYQERIDQLKQSIHSVRKYNPKSYICLYDTSDTPIKELDQKELSNLVDHFVDLSNHFFVNEIIKKLDSQDSNRGARKTIGELIGTLEFLGWLLNQEQKFNRVFKLSGRLRLNDNFLNVDYSSMVGKVCTTKRWWYDRYAYTIQLWSFDFSLLNEIYQIFVDIWNYEIEILNTRLEVDIVETTLFRFFKRYKVPVHEISTKIGIEGNFGQDGAIVNE